MIGAMVLGRGISWVEENVVGGNWERGVGDVVGENEGEIQQGEKKVA